MALVIHPRSDWLDPSFPWDGIVVPATGKKYYCPRKTDFSKTTEIVIHYPGSDWADMDLNKDGIINGNDTIYNMRQGHKMYMMDPGRGYSYGYCFIIGQEGEAWTSRGLDYTNAANKGDKYHNSEGWNTWSVSIQIIVDIDQPANAKQIECANELIKWICDRVPTINSLVWHGFRQYTACAGPVIPQVQDKTIHLPWQAPPVPEPEPEPEPTPEPKPLPDFPEGESNMDYILKPAGNWWPSNYDPAWLICYGSGRVRRATNGDVAYANDHEVPFYEQNSKEQYNSMLVDNGITYKPCP